MCVYLHNKNQNTSDTGGSFKFLKETKNNNFLRKPFKACFEEWNWQWGTFVLEKNRNSFNIVPCIMLLLRKREIYIETGLLNNKFLGINQRYLHHFLLLQKYMLLFGKPKKQGSRLHVLKGNLQIFSFCKYFAYLNLLG